MTAAVTVLYSFLMLGLLILPSTILGALVSLIKGYLLVFVLAVLLIIPIGKYDIYKESTIINFMLYKTPILSKYTNSFIEPIHDIIELTDLVANKKISSKEANTKAVEKMIEYNVVDTNTLEKLYETNKLDNIFIK